MLRVKHNRVFRNKQKFLNLVRLSITSPSPNIHYQTEYFSEELDKKPF